MAEIIVILKGKQFEFLYTAQDELIYQHPRQGCIPTINQRIKFLSENSGKLPIWFVE